MRKLFGTDGIRGVANVHPVTSEMVFQLGRATGYVFQQQHRQTVLVGKDTRISGDMLESALIAGMCSMGTNVSRAGVIPTPVLAYLCRTLSCQAGVMISASHNPMEDNGIKFFSDEGTKLPDAVEEEIERVIFSGEHNEIHPTGAEIGRVVEKHNAVDRYVQFAKRTLPEGVNLKGLTVVVDCANGSTYHVSPRVLAELGAEVVTINAEPDGTNINQNCGSTHPETIQHAVLTHLADVGIAHDGDGDRLIMVDERGRLVDGDYIMAIAGIEMLRAGRLPNNLVVASVTSNMGLDLALKPYGGVVRRTAVGDRYVWEEMVRSGATLGGEQSGHIIMREFTTTGDGLITALQVLAVMIARAQPLSELARCYQPLAQYALNLPVREKADFQRIPSIQRAIEHVEDRLGGRGRVLVRYSGTEPKIRILLEGEDESELRSLGDRIGDAFRSELGATQLQAA